MIASLIAILIVLIAAYAVIINYKKTKNQKKTLKWAFFHPFCNDGGGGEKVLWCMVEALLKETEGEVAVYSLEPLKQSILKKIKERFSIDLKEHESKLQIIYIPGRDLLTSKRYLTMLLHMILPVLYAAKCLYNYQPDIFYDTTGYASTLIFTKIFLPTCKTFAYVHYPFISYDMINKVKEQRVDFNNDASISKSPFKTKLKLVYYYVILFLYKINGYFVDYAQTNSTWTYGHVKKIWSMLDRQHKIVRLYPPCTVQNLLIIQKKVQKGQVEIVSLAQFRPEKKQLSQINIFNQLQKLCQKQNKKLRFSICGTTRGEEDEKILQTLKDKVMQLNLQEQITFVVNEPYTEIKKCLQKAHIGLHTMQAQHFGISIVQMLAAGLIVFAHNSAGPKEDIIKQERFLAEEDAEYVEKMYQIIIKAESELKDIRESNRKKSERFKEQVFNQEFLQGVIDSRKKGNKTE